MIGRRQAYSGHRIRQEFTKPVLRRVIELGLQILAQLPERDTSPPPLPKLGSLASRLNALAGKLDTVVRNDEVLARMEVLFEQGHPNRLRLQTLSDELRRGAEVVDALAKIKLKRVLSDSRNPQIRWAMYFVQWITSSTGRQQYRELATLFQAAFLIVRRRPPAWIDRLGVEMNLKRTRRKKWATRLLRSSRTDQPRR